MLMKVALFLCCLWLSNIPYTYHIYTPHLLYSFLCPWTSRLLPCPGYWEQCCCEHWGAHGFLNYTSIIKPKIIPAGEAALSTCRSFLFPGRCVPRDRLWLCHRARLGLLEGVWGSPSALLLGVGIAAASLENSMEAPQKTKHTTTIWPCDPTTGHISGEKYKDTLQYFKI